MVSAVKVSSLFLKLIFYYGVYLSYNGQMFFLKDQNCQVRYILALDDSAEIFRYFLFSLNRKISLWGDFEA